jgi:hypothetical protein
VCSVRSLGSMASRTRSRGSDSNEPRLIRCAPRFSLNVPNSTVQIDGNSVIAGADLRQDAFTCGKRYEIRARKKVSIFREEGETGKAKG